LAFLPIAFTIPQYDQVNLKNYWLKAFVPGTTTPKVMATDSTGGTTAARIELDTSGFPITAGAVRFIPFIENAYDLFAFPTAAEADANDTANAIQFADNIDPQAGSSTLEVTDPRYTIRFDDLTTAVADTTLADGDALELAERTAGSGGGAFWDVVLASTVTPNTFDIVISTGIGTLALVLRRDDTAIVSQWGLLDDWNGSTGTDNTSAFSRIVSEVNSGNITDIKATGNSFSFGTQVGDTTKFTFTSDCLIDWGGSEIVVDGSNISAFTDTTFIKATDSVVSMVNYIFDDIGFLSAGPSRGVIPFHIRNETANTSGYSLGPMRIKNGQSLLTATASDPNNFRASGISFIGSCTGGNMFYGVNLANNGDDFNGDYFVDRFNRVVFIYGVRDFNANADGRLGNASSANLLIANDGATFPDTKNVKIRSHIQVLDGQVDIAENPSSADGTFENIDLTLIIDAVGSNIDPTVGEALVQLGAFDSGGLFLSTGNTVMKEIRIDLQTDIAATNSIIVQTDSPNSDLIRVTPNTRFQYVGIGEDFHVANGNKIRREKAGVVNTLTVSIDSKHMTGTPKNGLVAAISRVVARNDTTGIISVIAMHIIHGSTDSSGNFTLVSAVQTHNSPTGGPTPAVTIGASTKFITAAVDTYTAANGRVSFELERL